jgi:hypothetical protein
LTFRSLTCAINVHYRNAGKRFELFSDKRFEVALLIVVDQSRNGYCEAIIVPWLILDG